MESVAIVSERGDHVEVEPKESPKDLTAYKLRRAHVYEIVPSTAVQELCVLKIPLFVGKALRVRVIPRIQTHRVEILKSSDPGVI
uniref:PEX-1N domain-containing protein n=1 Tax=Steinernema glaseri TaxID=37863 RepID=A0A1I7Y9N9_9BILA